MELSEAGYSSKPSRLLVVDDETPILNLLKTILERAHYDTVICDSAESAMELLKKEDFDCMITDVVMPDTDGYKLVRSVREDPELGRLPILMLTRKRMREDIQMAADAGVTGYILKPIDEHILLDKVRLCLKSDSKEDRIFECTVHGHQARAKLSIFTRVHTISESGLSVHLSRPMLKNSSFQLEAVVFDEIGMKAPMVSLIQCEKNPDESVRSGYPYLAHFGFMGLPEGDLRKIRAWIQKESIRRRK